MTTYEVQREAVIHADIERVRALIDSFHNWSSWSPWEDVDPTMRREHSGPQAGPGAHYAWEGNRKAGKGSMTIVASAPQRIDLVIDFDKPFKAHNPTSFILEPVDGGTHVRWLMTGEHRGVAALIFRFMSMDKLIGPDFERGLTRLEAAATA
ncbi:SRPBCC family protein [Pseudoclavibacter sp. RFBA6]|uniref:SRPBCC family protein n=1 Tax=Pseudoclavibacter sp. RFBA6 TaxID=2080573 RepID=UPI000CE89435|nr:SRPBCC family protein [Pseudoclavibacter sp. RFBA6]PPG40464.1 transcriptional regulator [Pseudoclavibacter sp. RFBA6]